MKNGKYSVLIVDTAIDFGGSIVSTANLIRGLDRSRFDPIFVSSTNEELVRNRLSEASASTNVYIAKKVLHYGRLARVIGAFRRVPNRFLQKALTYLLYFIRLALNIPYAARLAWLIRKFKVDLVQLNNAFGNDELELVCLLMRRPRVVFFRGYIKLSAIERRFFLPGVRGYVSVSEHVKTQAIEDGVPADMIAVATPPAILEPIDEATRTVVRRRYGVAEDELIFGLFGRIVAWKGHKEFVRAAAIVLRSFPNAKAFIVGDTSDGDEGYPVEVRALVRELGIEDQVVFTGYIDKVYELYGVMDIVVHASIEAEPSGRVIFEAMSCGVPVVASCYGGPKEFIDDGIDGYICDPLHPEQIAERVLTLLANASLRHLIGTRAQDKVDRMYNKAAYAAHVEQVYLRCLNHSASDKDNGSNRIVA